MPEPVKIPVSMPLSTPEPMNKAMPKVRKRLIISGLVQDIGYRAHIKFSALKLGIKGFTRNLEDDTVEIVCEGTSEAITKFIELINLKGDPSDQYSIKITSITEAQPPEGGLSKFHIDYGRELTIVERESLDREEMMVLRAGTLNSNVNMVGQKVDSMHADMNTRFDHMAEKYDLIADSLTKAVDHLDRGSKTTGKATE